MIQEDAGPAAALFHKALEHQRQGRMQAALDCYDAILRQVPAMAGAHLNRGIVLQALGGLDEALKSHARAIAIEPRNPNAWYHNATALARLGRYQDAVQTMIGRSV